MSHWYQEGTISLVNGSKTVTGVGTAWADNVAESNGLDTPAGIKEIESVTSNTSLQLVKPYAGPTVNGIAYAVIPTQGVAVSLVKRVVALLTSVGVMKDDYQAGNLGTDLKAAQLSPKTGASKIGADAPVAVPYLQTLSDIVNGNPVSLFRFIQPTKISEIRGFSTALDVAPAVQLAVNSGAKRLTAEYGLFNLESTVMMPLPVSIEGAGDGTIFHQRSVTTKASFYHRSISAAAKTDGFRFRDFVIQCTVGTFFEQQHLIELSGVRNVFFDGIKFYGFRGDGIYIGSGSGNEERHNENVQVRRCVFDGINNANRNAISVISGDGITIENNFFLRCSRNDMPGPIDFEPDANTWHTISDIKVLNNRFRANGGGVGEVAIYVPAAVTAPPTNIHVEGNESDGYVGTGSFFYHSSNRPPSDARVDSAMRLVANVARNGNRPWQIFDAQGAKLVANRWNNFKSSCLLGYADANNGVRDVSIQQDRYHRIGTVSKVGISIFSAQRLQIQDVLMEDCGDGASASYAIDFSTGTSSYVDIDGLTVTAPTGKTLVAIQKENAHTFTPKTNKFYRSNMSGLTNNFQAHESDSLETNYLPIIGGSTATGAGSYTRQIGRAKRIGTKAFVRLNVFCSASHFDNNKGIIQISLPWPCKQGGTLDTHIPVTVTGVPASIANAQYGVLVQALTVDGVLGGIRVFCSPNGTQANVDIPNTAFNVIANFSYEVAEGY